MRLYHFIQVAQERPIPTFLGSTGVSIASVGTTFIFIENFGPYVHFAGSCLAAVSGLIAVLLGLRALWRAARADWFPPPKK